MVLALSGVFFVLFLIVSGVMFFKKGAPATGAPVGGALFSQGSVGVVELKGMIMDSKKILRQLERFEESSEVKAVVLRLDSPGGSVAPSQEIYEAVKGYKKPLVVSMGSVAASGAYYIACGAKKVFANPGTITGSIGVIMEFLDLSKLYEWAKIHRYAIKTGKYKGSGAEYRELNPEERALLQTMIDDVLVQFKTAVAEGRKLPMEQVTEVADGRIFSGSQAKAAKLVDELGTLNDAIEAAAKEAKIEGKPRVVYPQKAQPRFLELLTGLDSSDEEEASAGRTSVLARVAREVVGLPLPVPGALDRQLTELAPGVYWLWRGAR